MYNKIRFFDLFAGIGGFHSAAINSNIPDLEFEPTGFCELDPVATSFYKAVHGADTFYIQDAKSIQTHKNPTGIKLRDIDLLFAGFPCQSFSNVGYRRGLNDDRGQLFYTILDMLNTYSPTFFILENVQKISTINKGDLLQEMQVALEEAGSGYHLHTWDLKATDYGLPQNRRRMFFCGIKKDSCKKLELAPPTKLELDSSKYPTVWHLLEKNNIDSKHYIPLKTRQTVLYKNPKWMGDVNIDNSIARPITASMSKWHRANQDNYISDAYMHGDSPYKRPIIDLELEPIRRITPLEGFRIQGFPDYYEEVRKQLTISYSASYRLIGNALPVDLAKAVINHFIGNYSKELDKDDYTYQIKQNNKEATL